MFLTPTDIGNRACQAMGVDRITSFTEDSVQASEVGFAYNLLRRAEMRRNTWQFAIRQATLRPVSTGTMVIGPALWASTTTYGFGAIVIDGNGIYWQSKGQDNLNQAPGVIAAAWDVYSGPLSVSAYDSTGTTNYYAGELVYETAGAGSYAVYLSLQNGNSQDPRAPSQWISTVQYIKDAVVMYYAAWAIGTTYAAGAGVSYLGIYYVSLAAGNVGNNPLTATSKWVATTTTLAPGYYSSTTAYAIGQFVTYLGANYICIAATTGNLPTNATYWAAQAVGTTYASLIDFNFNNDPGSAPALWASGTTYAAGNTVGATDGYIYSSIGSGNVGNNPTSTIGLWTNTGVLNPWTTTNPFGTANIAWQQLNVVLRDLQIVYPIGAGPAYQSQTKNVFRLPANFLRRAPQDPKAGSVSYLGAPSGLSYDDYELQDKYLVSRCPYPITLRFIADIADVSRMDDLFCELLASRIAYECVERVTQSTTKRIAILQAYKELKSAASTINGIETGPVEPPIDDYIDCRK